MEDRRTGALYLELAAATPDDYGRTRAVEVGDRTGVTRTTWWANQHPDRDDVPRRLAEFATLGLHELGPGFTPPTPVEGITEPAASTPGDVSQAQRQQRVAQWMVPVFTGALLVVSSLAGEQQKPGSVRRGVGARVRQFLTPSA